MLFLPPS